MKLLFILLFAYVTLFGESYLRTIRIASFLEEKDAQTSLENVKLFLQEHENLIHLKKENGFEFQVQKSGKYYVVLAEPFTNREVVQEVLDTLRLQYAGIYVKKLSSESVVPNVVKELDNSPILIVDSLPTERIKKEIVHETTFAEEEKKEQYSAPVPMSVQKTNTPQQEAVKVDKKPVSLESTTDTYFILFLFALLAFVITAVYLYIAKREKDSFINKDIILSTKLEQLNAELENKEMFLSHTTHELRTPMTSIMGLTHLVLESDLSSSQREYIQKIGSSAELLLNIINDILDVSKLESGKFKLERKEFNINDIFDYILNVVSIQIKNNNVNIKMDIDQDVPSHVIGDSLRVGQILINLLANAVKFTREGEVSLSVKKLSSFGDTIQLEFIISDTGIGMTEEQVEGLFQSFTQASESTSREFGGTGLGLSISKQLVEIMNGKIGVKSKKDVGTTFTLTIPFRLKDADNKRQYRLPSSSFLNKQVLVVDSSNRNAIALIGGLGYFNYATHVIPSFEDVVLTPDMTFDIIIIHQSRITELAKNKIQEIHSSTNQRPKLVVLSELYSGLNTNLIEESQIDGYLKTPFTQQNILNMIIELYVSKTLDTKSRKKSPKNRLKELKDKKILVAEDNVLNHKVIAGLLANTGIELTFVVNGQEVVDLLHKDLKFDMILMDVNMPIVDGYEATKEIRKHSKYDAIPIFALTADAQEDAVEKSLLSGMQGHITKPIIVDVFYGKILDTLSSKSENTYVKSTTNEEEEEFEELSVPMGLGRCNNDEKLYISILNDFKAMYASSAITLENLCSNDEFKAARKISMDIKDVSLNIGAYNLCENAAALEYELEKGARGNWREIVSLYAKGLEKLFVDIETYLVKV